jgi:hypothetical protein
LSAAFAGDGVHAAAVSSTVVVGVGQASVTATAAGATMTYGGVAPGLTGTLAGVLPRDAATVVANFTSSAPDLAGVGSYPIAAALSGVGSGNYVVELGVGSGVLQVVQAVPVVSVNAPQIAYAGLPVTMSASVGAIVRGVPTGVVNFLDGGTVVGSGAVAGGVATAVYLSPGAGTHSISAAYGGDRNFVAAASGVEMVSVGAMPDFSVSVSGNGTQTVQGGSIAGYGLQIAGAPGPFSGSVMLSASGTQAGAVVSFSPVAVVPGSGSVAVTMSVSTVALAVRRMGTDVRWAGMLVLLIPWRRRVRRAMVVAVFLCCGVGCGDRSVATSAGQAAETFPITVTATSTNLAGVVVVHTASVVLVVQ